MATIWVDGKEYEVDGSKNLLDVCLSLGMDLPYFCWHPAMGSVGACRQCAVKQYRDEEDDAGQLVMACMTAAGDGTRISLADEEAVEFRESVIEWLMVNHPHDCPICDEGGECHLQDMTVMTGHAYRRFRFKKRTHLNQYLGPFINHEMNRCIQCYRCVRFYRDFADGRDFDVFGAHDNVYFGRHEDGVLESEFSGNLVEICPTGVFTDKTLKQHYTRKWDLQTAPSVCTGCSVGCNTIPGERYGKLRRVRNRYNGEVNGYFLCDRGRYGYEYVNSERRIHHIQLQTPSAAGRDDVKALQAEFDEFQERLRQDIAAGRVVGVGSPRASLEGNFALRTLVGPEKFCSGVAAREQEMLQAVVTILGQGPARAPSLQDIKQADAVLVLGEDLTNTAPMMAYAVRQAARSSPRHKAAGEIGIPLWNDYAIREVVRDSKGPVYLATVAATKLEDIAREHAHAAPADIAQLGFAVAHAIDDDAPGVDQMDGARQALAQRIASSLQDAERPVVISGTGCGSLDVIQAAANIAWALSKRGVDAGLTYALPECNSMGSALLGGRPLEEARRMLVEGEANTLLVLENDLYRRAESQFVDSLLDAARRVVVLDALETETTKAADVVLPAATFAEGDGTLVSQEGRAQRYLQVFEPAGVTSSQNGAKESWRWIADMLLAAGRSEGWQTLDEILQSLAEHDPSLAAVASVTPPAGFRMVGQKVPRQPHRYSGRTAMRADRRVSEPKPPDDPDTPMSFSMEGFKGAPPPSLLPRYWTPGWNSVQALNKFQSEVGGPLKGGDPGLRLIEPDEQARPDYFAPLAESFSPRQEYLMVVPLWHIFGSEPFSMFTPGVAERAPKPYVALGSEDASRLQADEGQLFELVLGDVMIELPLRIVHSLPRGVAGLPAGLSGIRYVPLPGWIRTSTAEEGPA